MPETRAASSVSPEVTDEELLRAYRIAARSRALEQYIVRLVNKGEVSFAIWGPGEEIHGTATALALSRVVTPERFGLVPHYRSGCLCSMWCHLQGREEFTRDVLRQQFSRATDPMSRGRQMVYHLHLPEVGILPVQSPVGMQLGKAAGYAKGFQLKGVDGSISVAVIGDGTTAEGDLHDAMNAASVWQLPLIVMITDNGVAISTSPDDGRGIRDFEAYARSFGLRHVTCDGSDFHDTFAATLEAARYVAGEGKPVLLHVRDLPRFNGHSSAADVTFDLDQEDPLISFGADLVARGLLGEDDVLRRIEGQGRDFFAHHEPGAIMSAEVEAVRVMIDEIRGEPEPDPATLSDHTWAPFPDVEEEPGDGGTNISYAGAVRAALDHVIGSGDAVLWGQDVGGLGGVMTATAGLLARHPGKIIDAPLNEPLAVGAACGAGLHDDLTAIAEIQFGDYSLNTLHWLVHMGNLRWSTAGNARFKTIVRMPTDPFGGGAIYHSMSVEGYFSAIPGLVMVMPATSFDVYGLLMTAADYDGPVLVLEPKSMYRLTRGPAFPGEPTDAGEVADLRRRIVRGEVPDIDPDLRVPFSKAAIRREGDDVTVVSWGRAVWTAMDAAAELEADGVSAEVIDLRTLVPPDLDTVFDSVSRTRRLIVAAEDRAFAGFVRAIQGAAVERFDGLHTRALGQKNVPGIAQSHVLEEATILTKTDVAGAARELMAKRPSGGGFAWIPRRYGRM